MRARTAILALSAALALAAQTSAPDPDAVLARLRAQLRTMMQSLPRYTCVETVERRYFRREEHKGAAPSCDQIMGERKSRKPQLYAADRLRLDVAVAGGQEIVSWAGAGKFDSRSVEEVVGDGPTGTGSFGGHIIDVFANSGTHFQFLGEKEKGVLEYRFTVPLNASNYRIRGTGMWHFTPYDGTFQVDPRTLHLVRFNIRTDQLAPDTSMCEASTALEYQYLRIGESDFLLPLTSRLQIVETGGNESLNTTTYSSCREYHTESTIRFDGETPEGTAAAAQSAAALRELPEGLQVVLSLATRIDLGTAAAGDPVTARVVHAVREPKSKNTLIPAGAVVHGRLARVRHRLPWGDFVLLIAFDSLEVKGAAIPVHLKLDAVAQLARMRLTTVSRRVPQAYANQGPDTWGALIFPAPAGNTVVPAGYDSDWVTVAPKDTKN